MSAVAHAQTSDMLRDLLVNDCLLCFLGPSDNNTLNETDGEFAAIRVNFNGVSKDIDKTR